MSRYITVKLVDGAPGTVFYPLEVHTTEKPTPEKGQVLVRMQAAALNHRDVFLRQGLYPGISFTNPILADGYGAVVQLGPECHRTELLNSAVVFMPSHGWESAPEAPENPKTWTVIGGSKLTPLGTAQEYIVVSEDDVELAPEHLSPAEGAALPLAGLTAWRALVTKSGNAEKGRNILIIGIGGGVALQLLQFAVAKGCNVFMTSGSKDKLAKAKELGATDGVLYTSDTWEKGLQRLLPPTRPYIDAVIDSAGGDIVNRAVRLLKPGGVLVQYGMTLAPTMSWSMAAVLKNIELRGSTMGSKQEFRDMLEFVREHKVTPVVSKTIIVRGLDEVDAIETLFEEMKAGRQFGKLVLEIGGEPSTKL